MKRAGATRTALARARRRLESERWIIDAVRRSPPSRKLRSRLEWLRSRRIVATSGSVDAALDAIVRDAISVNEVRPTDRHSAETNGPDADGVVGGAP